MKLKTIGIPIRSSDDLMLMPMQACGDCTYRRGHGILQQCAAKGQYCSTVMREKSSCIYWSKRIPQPPRRSLIRWLWDTLLRWK